MALSNGLIIGRLLCCLPGAVDLHEQPDGEAIAHHQGMMVLPKALLEVEAERLLEGVGRVGWQVGQVCWWWAQDPTQVGLAQHHAVCCPDPCLLAQICAAVAQHSAAGGSRLRRQTNTIV